MDTQTAAEATPSVATESTPEIPRSGTAEYAQWRIDGTLPEKKQSQPAESTPADASKETISDNAPEPETGKSTQETRRKPGAEARIGELTSRVKQLERDLEEARRPKTTQAESSTAKSAPTQPQNYREWRKTFKPSKWVEKYGQENPEATYEDATAACADFQADVRDQFRQIEQQRDSQTKELNSKVTDARARYGEKFDEVVWPTLNTIVTDSGVNPNVKAMLNDSDVVTDLLFTIGSDQKTLNDFLSMAKSQPGKALRYLAVVENGIIEELSTGKSGRNERGQFTSSKSEETVAPAKRGPENAPEPPIEIGSRGSGPMDESARALSAAGRGDPNAFRQWKKAEDAKEMRRRRGL